MAERRRQAFAQSAAFSFQVMTSTLQLCMEPTDHPPCGLRCSWIFRAALVDESGDSADRVMVSVSRMKALYVWQEFPPCFFWMCTRSQISKHVSPLTTHLAWKAVLVSGRWSVRFMLSGPHAWELHQCRGGSCLNPKVWSLGSSCCGMGDFFLPFPVNCQNHRLSEVNPVLPWIQFWFLFSGETE